MEKKGLGKGLGALIPGAEREEKGATDIPIDKISLNPYQPRKTIDNDKFQDLVKSVRLHGVLQPIVVRSNGEGGYELVAGERRLRAATAAGLTRIPAIVKDFTNEQSLEVA
ncbi:MAG TPA: ParB/RepB/Spo0J family partition protein, partial [Armatimonadota bacterium]|nr:ParB/RepB/Spo0J family partition protein [Armatimonadota bacterium]